MTAIAAITLHRPWPALVLFAGKTDENRGWYTPYRGPLYIHAGQTWDDEALAFADRILLPDGTKASDWVSANPADHPTGIVGVVDLVDVLNGTSPSPWAMPDQYHWRLANPRPVRSVECRGRQRLWMPTAEIAAQLAEAVWL